MSDERIERLSADEAKQAGTAVGVPEMMGELAVFQVLLRNADAARAGRIRRERRFVSTTCAR